MTEEIKDYIQLRPMSREPYGPDWGRFGLLYHEAFPADERRPWEDFCALVRERECFEPYGIYRADRWVGFITLWRLGAERYVEHFAVLPGERGTGTGSAALALLDGPLILEVEPPVDAATEARVRFYRRAGFILHDDVAYVQPPYAPGLSAVPLMLMTRGLDRALHADDELIRSIKRQVYGHCL